MNNIMDFWRSEWAAVTDMREVSNILSNDFSPIREVVVVLTNNITGTYEARSYPNDDYDGNGMIELYEVDVYEILIKGADENGNSIVKKWEAPRFMPYWNSPQDPDPHYKHLGWINAGLYSPKTITVPRYKKDYELQNRLSNFKGAIVLQGSFYIHAGPADKQDFGCGSAGCIEIIGNFDDFKTDIMKLSGIENRTADEAIGMIVQNKKLKVKIEAATPPDIRSRFTREVHPSEL